MKIPGCTSVICQAFQALTRKPTNEVAKTTGGHVSPFERFRKVNESDNAYWASRMPEELPDAESVKKIACKPCKRLGKAEMLSQKRGK